jgi:GNAT superfamily N-acetyltransferase
MNCNAAGCGKPASMQCPECLGLNIAQGSYFCDQDCFKASWKTHKMCHNQPPAAPAPVPAGAVAGASGSGPMGDDMDDEECLLQANAVQIVVAPFEFLDKAGAPTGYQIRSINSSAVTMVQRNAMFALLKGNMQDIYNACSWGWEEKKRFADVSHVNSRFLAVYRPETPDVIEAFCMFRFDWDDDDEPEYAVLYVYELQVSEALRGRGVGWQLMQICTALQAQYHMKKTMLTCFKHNAAALGFYKTIGFGIDFNSPTCHGRTDAEYEILSNRPDKRLA